MDPAAIDRTAEKKLQGRGPEDSILQISAFSRPLELGMLYNALNDSLIPGISLWKIEDINSRTRVSPQPNTKFQVEASESLKQKTSLLDVSASVKLSFFSGLLEAGGSAKYLNDKLSSAHQCRVTLSYHVTSKFEQLMISELETPKPEVIKMTDATHVVSGVVYGADALMEFEETASDASRKQEIHGNLNVMIKKIPSIEISGEGSLKMDDKDMEKVKNMSCKFYGDFQLKEIPSTYEQAVKVYKELPNLLGEKGENAVPVKIWLYPLSRLSDTEFKLKKMISELLVSELENVMDAFHQAEVRTSDLLEISKEIKAEDITHPLEQFQCSLRVFSTAYLQKIADLIPTIREGKMEEMALRDLLNSQDASGFNKKEMEHFLDGKETEINIVKMIINKIQDYKIKSPGTELDSFLMNTDVSDAFVFSFTSLRYEEPYLKKISQAAENFRGVSTISTHEQEPSEEDPWYKRTDVKEALHSSLSVFNNAPKNKVISFISDPEHPGASIRWYHNAMLKDLHVTTFPVHLYACELTLDPDTASSYFVLSEGKRKVTRVQAVQPYPDLPDRFDVYTQVLCKEPLTGRCYWECEWSGKGVCIAVAYESMARKGYGLDSGLGCNDKSWLLWADTEGYVVMSSNVKADIPAPPSGSSRVGVYLDREGGTLSFYSISSDTLMPWYTFNITFTTEQIYAGFWLDCDSQVSLC